MLNLRILTVDSYIASPVSGLDPTYSHFRGSVIHQVPVLRIFGITPTGEKGCLHIHGVFPYLLIPLDKNVNVNGFIHQLSENLDKQLNKICNSKYNKQNVFKITQVKGIPFYGYHDKKHDYLKVYFYKPSLIKKAANILQEGQVLGQSFQPHEAHIPYVLQFFIDYNLYGMSHLNIEKFTLRKEGIESDNSKHLEKVSFCQLEADAIADDILNVSQVSGSSISNPGLIHIWEEEKERRRNEELSSDPSIQSYQNLDNTYRSEYESKRITQLLDAVKERIKIKLSHNDYPANDSITLDASFRESHRTEDLHRELLDSQDLLLLDAFRKNLECEDYQQEQDCVPDGDSILGSQRNPLEEESSSEDENTDLTQPLHVSESEISDSEEVDANEIDKCNTLQNSNLNLSRKVNTINKIINIEDSSIDFNDLERLNNSSNSKKFTPKKHRRSNPTTPNRYSSLDVTVKKSPRSRAPSGDFSEKEFLSSQNSPKARTFFDKFQLNATLIQLKKKLSQNDDEIAESSISKKDIENVEKIADQRRLDTTLSGKTAIFSKTNKQRLAKKYLDFGCSNIVELDKHHLEDIDNQSLSIRESGENNFLRNNANISCADKSISKISTTPCLDSNLSMKQNGLKSYLTLLEPPGKEEVIKKMDTLCLQIKKVTSLFFSEPQDEVSRKNIGSEAISISSSLWRNLNEFKGLFYCGDIKAMNQLQLNNSERAMDSVVLFPIKIPPTRKESLNWLMSFMSNKITPSQSKEGKHSFEEDHLDSYENYNAFEFSCTSFVGDDAPSCNLQLKDVLEREKKSEMLKYEENLPVISPLLNKDTNSCVIEKATLDGDSIMCEEEQITKLSTSIHKYITLLAMELHIQTRGTFNPDPEYDRINSLFYCLVNDVPQECAVLKKLIGVIVVCSETNPEFLSHHLKCEVTAVRTEEELLTKFVDIVRFHDPDILVGYETEMLSWTYLINRGHLLGINLYSLLGRIKDFSDSQLEMKLKVNEEFQLKIVGRIILNVWRLMRYEAALMSYSFENVLYHILRTRVPHYSFKTLSEWWNSSLSDRVLTLRYYLTRVEGTVKLLEKLDFIGRTSELATLFGIQFFEVLSRGSQFRVESIMLRMAKPKNYIAVSPSIQQRSAMRAPSSLPLIMEPHSRLYEDPVIVLDFQSLYPSMIIAYNYCFSTCLGLQQHLLEKDEITFGCTSLLIDPKELYRAKEHLHISPAGAVFVDSSIRRGILPRMLEEILETRLMLKNSMKRHKSNKPLYQVLDARQLGLKLIANVTYGYTSANFSGRMPCIEVGDSVVSKGRETLERAIKLVEKTKTWGAEVVYGDTDSMFVLCRGKSRQEAFRIGQEIADAVTLDNPKPVKLKLEKVYQPCILQTKKRYVGFMYESAEQEKPEFDAKGIETVRRDGCPAASKEYRGLRSYQPSACVPALKLAKEWIAKDKRSEPRIGERVGYIITCGPPGVPLIQLVKAPYELLTNTSLKINSEYYITKAILPCLDRCFTLLGVNVFSWYKLLPKKQFLRRQLHAEVGLKRATLSQYFLMENCIVCDEITNSSVCAKCQKNAQLLSATVMNKIYSTERKFTLLTQICSSCSERFVENECISLDCPIFFSRMQASNEYKDVPYLRNIIVDCFPD
ncbi:DNA polymerase zeta catalytic subunit isoform X2 [Rhodnius prolixus]|uniref:DNA polymerase zeta catalytic subunit isoform X2 n=1 Tax=Rhodnius prolixus TaxID=13249 RepID=UPI003D18D85B